MSQEKQFCRNCGKRDLAFSQEDTVRFWEPGLCSECHRLPVVVTRYDAFTGERIQPQITWQIDAPPETSLSIETNAQDVVPRIGSTPKHDGKLGEGYSATFESGYAVIRGGSCDFAELSPQQALSLLAWLIQEKPALEQLAKEQAEPSETYIDFAEHLPPAVWKSSLPCVFSLTAACLSCHAEMHGEWEGESPYTLVCPSCGQSHSIEERIS